MPVFILSQPAIIEGPNPKGWIFPDGWTASTEVIA